MMVNDFAAKYKIQLWFPELFASKGGIQVYIHWFFNALQFVSSDCCYNLFIKNDNKIKSGFNIKDNYSICFAGNWPLRFRTAVYAFQIFICGCWQKPNLVILGHLNFTQVAYFLHRVTGIPYWIITYGFEAWDIHNATLRRGLSHADRIISISGYTRDRLIKEQNIDPKKISILPCTFDESNLEIAPKPAYLLEKYGLNPEQPIILTVSRLAGMERYKGYDRILEAMPQIRQALPNAHYIIVGKGDDRPRIEQLIAEKGLEDCVTLAGFVPDEQLGDYYNLCDVFAMPSKKEGFGIVYLEALACGKPVLGGNQDGAIDALCHGELGALVNPDDAEEIAKTLIQILQGDYPNPLMYQPEALRQKVIDTFGFERFKQTLAELMKDSPIGADL